MAQTTKSLSDPVTVVFSWTVKPGKRQLFEHMMHDIHKVARTFPGHMGVTTIKSPERSDNFQTVLRFDNYEHLVAWLRSPTRQNMMQALGEVAHIDIDVATKATGLETWFEIPGQVVTPPPRWKMVVTTFIAIYPISLLFGYFVTPYTASLPIWVRALFLPVFAPIMLTYLIMPLLTQRVLKRWLYQHR
jgi:uncharacterized protein